MRLPWKRRPKHKFDESERPDALAPVRQRSLTLPLSETQSSVSGGVPKANDQGGSLFYSKLPFDIRRLIYQEVLAPDDGSELHVASSEWRLLSRRCFDNNPDIQGWQHSCWGYTRKDGTSFDWRFPAGKLAAKGVRPPRDAGVEPTVMGLLCSCRQIYSEAIDILYTDNILSVRQTRTIVDLAQTILPQRLSAIRSLHIDAPLEVQYCKNEPCCDSTLFPDDIGYYWDSAWEAISQMKGLKNLRVTFSQRQYPFYITDTLSLIRMFEQMVAINVPNYLVEFHRPIELEEILQAYGGQVPFLIEVKKPVPVHGISNS